MKQPPRTIAFPVSVLDVRDARLCMPRTDVTNCIHTLCRFLVFSDEGSREPKRHTVSDASLSIQIDTFISRAY